MPGGDKTNEKDHAERFGLDAITPGRIPYGGKIVLSPSDAMIHEDGLSS